MSTFNKGLSSLTSYNPYHDSTSIINKLKQERSPKLSHEDYEDNDKFLQDLENENLMLEKELESLIQLKSSQQKEIEEAYGPSLGQSPSADQNNLEKIEETIEEERESYYYSNSDADLSGNNGKSNRVKKNPSNPELGHYVKFGQPDLNKRKRSHQEEDSLETEKDRYYTSINSPLRTSHLAKSEQDENSNDQNKSSSSRASRNNKENISINEEDAHRKKAGNSKSKNKTNSPPKYEKIDKTASLEFRLAGANRAIKSLEGELKIKNDKILELSREIERKSKLIESQNSHSLSGSQLQKSSQVKESLTTLMRKKEKEAEKKIKEQEVMLTENKKYMTRLQELNSKLLTKVKELEDENLFLKTNQDAFTRIKALEDENKKLKEKNKNLDSENSELRIQGGEQKNRLVKLVEVYDNFEKKSERFIHKNKTMTDTLLDLITLHNSTKVE